MVSYQNHRADLCLHRYMDTSYDCRRSPGSGCRGVRYRTLWTPVSHLDIRPCATLSANIGLPRYDQDQMEPNGRFSVRFLTTIPPEAGSSFKGARETGIIYLRWPSATKGYSVLTKPQLRRLRCPSGSQRQAFHRWPGAELRWRTSTNEQR